MEYSGKILCATHEELTAVMTEQNVKNLRHRGQLQQIRRACPGYPALFAVDSLPEKYKKQVLAMYPMPDKEIQSNFTILPDCEAVRFFDTFVLDDGRHLPEDKRTELVANAEILNAFGKVLEKSDKANTSCGQKTINRTDFWKRAAAYLQTLSEKNSLPRNARELQRKFNAYCKEGYSALVGKRWGLTNAAKVKDVQESALIELLKVPNCWNNVQIVNNYNMLAELNGWKPISDGTVANWRKKHALITDAAQHGTNHFFNTKAMIVKRSRPTAPFLMWSLDGWDCELRFQDTKNGRTTYYDRLVVEIVLDPVNDYIIGYAIGFKENAELITAALKNALLHSQQLFGTMHKTNQIQSDHFAMSAMKAVYAAVADKVTPARVGNAKSKPIERFFGYLNRTYCQMCTNWAGFGITTNPDKQPNSEWHDKNKHELPDLNGVTAQITAMIETDRRKKQAEFVDKYADLQDDRKLEMSRADFLYYFGETTGHTNRLASTGLMPTILGQKRVYDCFNIKFRELAFTDWTVKYDPDDLSTVLAVNPDGTQSFLLEEKYVQPMALADRKEGDAEELQRVRDFNQNLQDYVMDTLAAHADKTAKIVRLPERTPNPYDVLRRMLLTDSTGDHKTNKKRAALKAASPDPPPNPDYDMF